MSLEGSEYKLEGKFEMDFPITYSPISGDEESQTSGERSTPAVTPEKESAVTPEQKAPTKKFAEVVGRKQKDIDIENLEKYEDLLKKEGNEIAVKKDMEKKEEIEKKRIIYKTYSTTTKSIQKVEECKIEECLKTIRKDITYINRGRRFGTVEVRFRTEEIAKKLSTEPQKAGNLVLLPLYKGRRTSKIVMRNIPPEADASCLVAAVMLGLKEKINILQATVEEEGFWQGQIITMAIQAEAQTLEEIPEVLRLDEEERVLVFVEGRKPRCFGCGKKGHVRAECQPKPQTEEPSEKEETEEKRKPKRWKKLQKRKKKTKKRRGGLKLPKKNGKLKPPLKKKKT
ncbi:EPM2A-interacting 1-like [Octopus vulgaris]|uniref:EPM2A-interacting 1-like n=1 Tax=Octopus vulgaris TaxID=6645 RepID=A0AA36BXV8_OCTVU|nr:EPM2A-interacting 1-like [Octopus vulgaris]